MSDLVSRALSGGARIKFIDATHIAICFTPSKMTAANELEMLPEICSPAIDIAELAAHLGLVVAGAFTRLGRWVGKRFEW